MRFLSIEDRESLAVDQDSPLSQYIFGFRHIAEAEDTDKCNTEMPRKKVETAVIYPDDSSRVLYNIRQRSYASLTIKEDRNADERNTVDVDPLRSLTDGHY